MIVLGVDPGATGALALLGRDGLLAVEDMPVAGGEVDPAQLAALLREWRTTYGPPALVVVEQQSTRPAQGVSSAGKLMMRYGMVRGVVAALGWPIDLVTPAHWKRTARVPSRPGMTDAEKKEAARARAGEVFPTWAGHWSRKRDHGRAEAALIAHFGVAKF